ncbi:MAG: SBBP repeat-containing protein [Acidobacteriales bacterium]|nr:SBBP repeat-containing protein [Terriglobales bacterium]
MTLNRHLRQQLSGKALLAAAALFSFAALLLGSASPSHQGSDSSPLNNPSWLATPADHARAVTAEAAFSRLPLIFEANQGQSDPRVKYLSRGLGYGLFLTRDEAVLDLRPVAPKTPDSILRMSLDGANSTLTVAGDQLLAGRSNYFVGRNSAKWRRAIPQFSTVRYHQVYPGIDLVYYGDQGRLEYDFQIEPGADPRQISLRFHGQNGLHLNSAGDLLLVTATGAEVRLQAPHVYQANGSSTDPVDGKFVVKNDEVSFALGPYDRRRSLIIDPVLVYSTYLGGGGAESCSALLGVTPPGGPGTPQCPAIAVDSASNIYVAGATTSADFPAPSGGLGFQKCLDNLANAPPCPAASQSDAFVAKINPNASGSSQLIYATYLGGSGMEYTAGIAVDAQGDAIVAGTTTSATDFPTVNAFQAAPVSAGSHVFVSKLNPTGSSLLYSTYLAGNGDDVATGLALDAGGDAYVTGTTTSTDAAGASTEFPAIPGAFETTSTAPIEYFFSRLNPSASGSASLIYSTYIGPLAPVTTGNAVGGGIAVTPGTTNPDVYLTGGTNLLLPVVNAYQGTVRGTLNAWVAKFTAPVSPSTDYTQGYFTYLGGSGSDVGYGIAVDSSSNAYVTGSTTSPDFVTTAPTGVAAFQPCLDAPPPAVAPCTTPPSPKSNAFIAKLGTPCTGTGCTPTTVPLKYFSYLGGAGPDTGLAIAVDSSSDARVTGWTESSNFPVFNHPAGVGAGGGVDAFVASIDTAATTACTPSSSVVCPGYSTYLGGSNTDVGTSIALDPQQATYVAGETSSGNFPRANPFQASLNGPSDAFISKLAANVNFTVTESVEPSGTVGVGNQVVFTYTITNTGDLATGVTFTDTFPTSGAPTFVSATSSPGSCSTPAGNAVECFIGTLNTNAVATVTVTFTATAATAGFTDSGQVTVAGSGAVFTASTPASVTVVDFSVSATPPSVTVTAGLFATYQITVSPVPAGATDPSTVSLSCGSGLPTGAACVFTNPTFTLATGPQSSTLRITTTQRVTTTTQLLRETAPLWATWLPVAGLALLSMPRTVKKPRKHRLPAGLLLGGLISLVLLQVNCGSSHNTSTTSGTPAGSYTITVDALSGTATRTTTVGLVVQ